VRKVGDALVRIMTRLGLGGRRMHVLSVRGRRSGRTYSTPVQLVEEDGERWLVAPYGDVGWVRNARAAGDVTLRRGRRSETVGLEEVDAERAAPVLRSYVRAISLVRPYFDAEPDAPLEEFAAEASRHPVFRIVERGGA
jgi:deazaflavin-dependent oxidoreductase (nitroreductase family)